VPHAGLLLASASPRRAELLRAAGFEFEILPVDIDEQPVPGEAPEQYVARLAEEKAAAAQRLRPDAIVIGADTAVVLDRQIFGKPAGRADAERMLGTLSGRTHEVLTGLCVARDTRSERHVERSQVTMASLDPRTIAWYVASGEPLDKAGAYAVQGLASRFVAEIRGSYSNVVGLPVAPLCRLLTAVGCDILKHTTTPR
jgi:septum formation protein